MKTAVLISGQMRTFARCFASQRWHVFRQLPEPHFFVCVQDNADAGSVDLLREAYGSARVHVRLLHDPDLSSQLTPELAKAYHQAPYANAAPAHQLLLQHWYQNEAWKLFTESPGWGTPEDFAAIVRIRGDLFFHSCALPRYGDRIRVDVPECQTPWWGRFGGANDRFAIMGPEAARYYFTVYERIPELLAAGCPFHPESLLLACIEGSWHYPILRAEFSTVRPPGPPRPGEYQAPDGYAIRPPEISPIDLAHAGLASS